MKFTDKKLVELQKVITRGTKVITESNKTYSFDGFDDVECQYTYCAMHPRNSASKKNSLKCEGFMKWIEESTGDQVTDCPYIGGQEFTVTKEEPVKFIIKKTKDAATGEIIEVKVEPENY